jgi:hypothetical protein
MGNWILMPYEVTYYSTGCMAPYDVLFKVVCKLIIIVIICIDTVESVVLFALTVFPLYL